MEVEKEKVPPLTNYLQKSLGWNEGETEGGGGVLEAGELLPFLLGLRLDEDFRFERHVELQQVPQDTRQRVRHRR